MARRVDGTRGMGDRARSHRGSAAARGAALAVGVLAAAGAAAIDDATLELLTLDEAVELALAGNPDVRAAALAVERGGEAIAAARTHYLPAVSGQAWPGRACNSPGSVARRIGRSCRRSAQGSSPTPKGTTRRRLVSSDDARRARCTARGRRMRSPYRPRTTPGSR